MRRSILIVAAIGCSWSFSLSAQPAAANPAADATKFITALLDKFNGGDIKAWLSAQVDNASIVDEFAPHLWTGAGSPRRWLDAYAKDSQANGVTGGRLDYGKPLQATSDGKTAYVVMPATYRFVQKGTKMAEPGSMTFVMTRDGAGWKIASWTYSARAAAAPEK